MKIFFAAIFIVLTLLLFHQFFLGLRQYAKHSTENRREQLKAIRELEGPVDRNRQVGDFHDGASNQDFAVVMREFARACVDWEISNRRNSYQSGEGASKEWQASPRLSALLDFIVDSDNPDVADSLNHLILEGRDAECYWAAWAAVRRQEMSAFDAIWERVSNSKGVHADVRERLYCMAAEFPRDYSGPFLAGQLQDSDYRVRDAACRMLAAGPSLDALPGLSALLKTTSMSERDSVVDAVVALGSAAVPVLSDIAGGGSNSNARDAALIALSRIPDRRALKVAFDAMLLESALLKNRSLEACIDDCRRVMADNSGKYREDEVANASNLLNAIYELLCDEVVSPVEAVRCSAVELMGQIPLSAAGQRVRSIFESEGSEKVKAVAMRSLRYSKDPATLEAAYKNIVSADDKLRGAASDVILKSLCDDMLERLTPAIAHKNPDVRATALWLLGQLGSEKSRSILIENLSDPSVVVIHRICFQLERMKRRESDIIWLKKLCANRDVAVRNCVSKMLGKLDTPDARTLLIEMVQSDVPGRSFEILGKSADPRVFWPLFESMVKRKSTITRSCYPDALRHMASDHWQKLMPMLDDTERTRKSLAAALLGNLDIVPVRSELRRRIRAGDRNVIVQSADSFVRQPDAEVVKILTKIIEDDEDKDVACELAFRYYNTENALTKAACKWLTDHNYQIITIMVPVKKN